jgi:integrase
LTFTDVLPTDNEVKRKINSKLETVTVGNVTVKIYKRARKINGKTYRCFEVADFTNGQRRLRSFNDGAKARNEAKKIARQISTGETTAATMRNSEAASFGRAIELLRPTGMALEIAAAAYAKAFEILGSDAIIEAAKFYSRHRADRVARKPVADVVVELIAVMEAKDKSARYIADLRARLTRFAEAFGANPSTISEPDKKDKTGTDARNHGVDISSITTADVQRWLDGLKVGAQTTKNFRTVLNRLFSFAELRGYVFKGGNPVEDTESISANGGEIQIFTPDEITALLAAATPDFLPVIALGAFAGLRAAEAERIEFSNIDLAGGFIHISAANAKTRSRRLVPIQPNLSAWLAPYAKHKGKVWKGTPDDLREARAVTVKASGVAWKDNGLRHSFISYRLADIQNAAQVALEAGNSPNVVFKHYREIVKPNAAKAWFAIAPETPSNVTALAAARVAK